MVTMDIYVLCARYSQACHKKWKVEWEAQTGLYQWSILTIENSCGCTALDMLDWREMTKRIDWLGKQPSQVACISEDLKCWAALDTTCRHKAKDITPSITWRREVWQEDALNSLPWKDKSGLLSIRWTLEPFLDNVGETSERRGGTHSLWAFLCT